MVSFTLPPLIAHCPKYASGVRFSVSVTSSQEVPVAQGVGLPGVLGDPTWEGSFLGEWDIAKPSTTESQNHRMVGVGRDLCGSSSSILLKGQLSFLLLVAR